ncbi:TonB-dependent receptor plug domain-containing protein [Marivirga sp. S37H4]|uniref:TonB-dependent receptor plug domain-containing protein n=1 Tax=Marivirga aurantiaca TaxID=2802615 RepID=A0A934WWK6_9BACT|nr:TonB-dependent receptor plug domain-containing protein [Marivirga aurantiaca]MBK6264419.1 TonB-dependent receptor plug domain-containing protein [Marivirga aurantiaca]
MKLHYLTTKLLLFFLFVPLICSYAQESEDDFDILSLEELMNISVSVASNTQLTQRESPGIISVITEREIANMGARDLMDVLNMIPGVSLGKDVQGTVGFGLRGNWGFEGKILILMDGIEMNETLFATTPLGNHFNVSNISKIEIIRGPGSSIYGGFAELGVINIITKHGEEVNGLSATGTYGTGEKTFARRNLSLTTGDKLGDFEYVVNGFIGQGNRSESVFEDINGVRASLTDQNRLDPTLLSTKMKYKDLSLKLIYDGYETTSLNWYGEIEENAPYSMSFKSVYGELKYEYKLSEKISIIPRLEVKNQKPWRVSDSEDWLYEISASRTRGNVTSNIQFTENINMQAGFEVYSDVAKDISGGTDYFGPGESEVDYFNTAVFAQTRFISNLANLTLGLRYDEHSEFGGALSPRLGVTKTWGKLHTKFLYNQSFRAPAIENINLSFDGTIAPERTQVFEFELGFQVSPKMILVANLFDITIKDPIVYFLDEEGGEGYENFPETGTRGFDIESKYKDKWGYININYSFYSSNNKNEVPLYNIPDEDASLLGMPNHRLNLYSNFKIGNNFSINPSFNLYGKRYTVTGLDGNGDTTFGAVDSDLFLNLFFNYRNLWKDRIDIGIGVYDVLDRKMKFIQPYDGGHLPLPGMGRELMVRMSFKTNW